MYCNEISDDVTPVKTALLLAAGTGSRLSPLTDSTPKCLVEVDGTPILERLICALSSHGFKRLVVVVGHLSEVIQDYLGSHYAGIEITYIVSPLYKTTNNIYSLWLAGKVIDEPFLLIESDLVFQPALLQPMLRPDRIAISKQLPWMNGTTVTLDERQQLDAFCLGTVGNNEARHFKTVNIYSLSRTTWQLIWQRLDRHIAADNVQSYYETVFAELVAEGDLSFTPVIFDADRWYEIDTLEDLRAAEKLLPTPATIKAVSLRAQNGDDVKKYADLSDVIRPLSVVTTAD